MQVKVHVLDNGQRVIAAEDAEKLFQWLAAAPEVGMVHKVYIAGL